MPVVFMLVKFLIILVIIYYVIKFGMKIFSEVEMDFDIKEKIDDVKASSDTAKEIRKIQAKHKDLIDNKDENDKTINEFLDK